MKEYRRICADIDLDALTHNLDEIHRCIRKETKTIAQKLLSLTDALLLQKV